MAAAFFILAVALMFAGHLFKVKRWGLFISVYEKPADYNLLNALAIGHSLNALLPVRIGDIVRVIWSGRRMKNGYPFALATVIADIYVDVLTVGIIFFALSFTISEGSWLQTVFHFYLAVFAVLVVLTLIAAVFRKQLKWCIRIAASIFNTKIEYGLLYASYLAIASIKDIATRLSKVKFCLYTAGMWAGYLCSYVAFAESVRRMGHVWSGTDVFTVLFSGTALYNVDSGLIPSLAAYLILPLVICAAVSFVLSRRFSGDAGGGTRHTLPQLNKSDRLAFLKTYYREDSREHIQAYLSLNDDVTVIEDNSAGSNASTLLVMKSGGEMLFRKYAFDKDGLKLQDQIDWILKHQKDIPLPVVVSEQKGANYVSYDMHSYGSAVGLFRYIHTMPVDWSWRILEKALDDIRLGLHSKNARPADAETIKAYIKSKVDKNLKIIKENDRFIRQLEEYDEIYANGIKLPTLHSYLDMLSAGHLIPIFSHDSYSDIHGDLTIENIVCLTDSSEIDRSEYEGKILPKDYYFIDPNTGNIHDSPFLDYGKLLQSLHGNYEFLMMVKSVKIDGNNVNYLMTKSEAYGEIYQKFREYLRSRFSKEEVLSIYYHEIIHWLRLMPYKIRKNEKLAVVFYTGLLYVLHEVREMENGK